MDFSALASVFPIAIGDMDGDGKLDLVVGGGPGSQAICVYRNTATVGSITTNSFAPRVDFAAPGWVNSLTLADLDGDGRLDIALVSQLSSVFSIFKNVSVPGSFTTNSLAARVDYAAGYNPNGIAVGDLDGDGRPDIVFANTYNNTLSIYQNIVPFGVAPVITSQPTNQTAGRRQRHFQCHGQWHVAVELPVELQHDKHRGGDQHNTDADERAIFTSRQLRRAADQQLWLHPQFQCPVDGE